MTIYTLFINGKQRDYTDKRRAYAVARLFGAVVFSRERSKSLITY